MERVNKEQTLKNIKIALIMMFITMGLAIVVSTLVFIVVFANLEAFINAANNQDTSQIISLTRQISAVTIISSLTSIPGIIGLVYYIIVYITSFKLSKKDIMILMSVGLLVNLVGMVALFIYRSRLLENTQE
ncbi:MAG: hypothetical protein GX343_01635 [Erysipelotrichaceae bacterium]|jgi:hypothetical protein|nr:hypothetical protein [Bacillota bacterium]NLJ32522.1 hypothetical protein [Erysipelotrichaceae bacterium]